MNGPTYYGDAARDLYPSRRFSCGPDTDYATLATDDDLPLPTQAELDAHWATMKPVAEWLPHQFMDRFTAQETLGIIAAKRTNDELEFLWSRALTGPVSSNSAEFLSGMAALVLLGVLTQERADEISDPTR